MTPWHAQDPLSVRVCGADLQIRVDPADPRARPDEATVRLLRLLQWAADGEPDPAASPGLGSVRSLLRRPGVEFGGLQIAQGDHPALDPFVEHFAPEEAPAPPPVAEDPPKDPTARHFEIKFVDEVGDPIDGIDIEFKYLGAPHKVTTDGSGVATFEGEEVSFATAGIIDSKAVRKKLAPRWQAPRDPVIPQEEEGAPVYVEALDDHFDPIRLVHNEPATVVITPRFACREVEASTFDFARTFPKRSCLQRLAEIAEELQQDDSQKCMIYGHTDKSGSDELNKRLSERRARVIFALLTHDAALWKGMWTGQNSDDGPYWFEAWGTLQLQHMLNSLNCFDDNGVELDEDGGYGSKTIQAVKRFQRGDYPAKPAEQKPLAETGMSGEATREEMFLAYAKLVTREPVDTARIAKIGEAPFMGCGEFNPLSLAAKDRESRRAVVFIFDPAAEPKAPPCKLKDTATCRANFGDEPEEAPFYRCEHYKKLAKCCTPVGGPDLAHDVIVRFHLPLLEANKLPEAFILESDDDPDDDVEDANFSQKQALASDAKASVPPNEADEDAPDNPDVSDENVDETAESICELHFTHVPDGANYRLRVEGVKDPYAVFHKTKFHAISELSGPTARQLFPAIAAVLAKPLPPML